MKKLLVGVDGSQRSFDALRWAKQLADSLALTTTTVTATGHDTAAVFSLSGDTPSDDLEAITDAVAKRIADMGLGDVEVEVVAGAPSAVLHEAASSPDVVGLVVGTRGLGTLPGLLLGSVSRKLLFDCVHPLFLLPDGAPPIDHVLMAVDDSAVSASVAEWCARLAAKLGADATVVRCVDPGSELPPGHVEEYLDETRSLVDERWCGPLRLRDVQYDVVAVRGDARARITEVAQDRSASLIVVAGRGAGQFQGLGGTTSYLVRHSRIPLAVVPCDPNWSPAEL